MYSNRKSTKSAKMQKNLFNLHICVIYIIAAVLTDHISIAQPQNNHVDTEPSEVMLLEGQKTSLLCRSGLPVNYCRIKIPGEEILNLSPDWEQPRFQYYGTGLQSGQCGVTIERVSARNHGLVECNLGIRAGEATGKINLIVALSPTNPEIEIIPPKQEFIVGEMFRARCIVKEGRPAANITWFLDNEPIYEGLGQREEIQSIDYKNNTTLITTLQEIQRILTPHDNGKTLICRASHIADQNNRPKESKFQFFLQYPPQPLGIVNVYGLQLGSTAFINVTIESNPRPRIDWIIDGMVIPQGTQKGRYEAYEPYDLGNGRYNVTFNIAGLTLEDTNKDYYLRASNKLGQQEYTIRISSSNTPPSSGLDVGAIVGIVVALMVIVIAVLLIIFARATGRWCFAGKSSKTTTTSETSDTESTEVKVSKFRKLPKFEALFMKKSDNSSSAATAASGQNNNEHQSIDDVEGGGTATGKDNDGNDNEPKEDKQLVYAELVLKPSNDDSSSKPLTQGQQPPKSTSTEYAEIVYVQKGQGQDETTKLTKDKSK